MPQLVTICHSLTHSLTHSPIHSLICMAVRRPNNRTQRMQSLDPYQSTTQKRVSKGVGECFAFRAGECSRGDSCKFSHSLTDTLTHSPDSDSSEVIYLQVPRLYVNNLSWNVTWQDLKGLFRRVSYSLTHSLTHSRTKPPTII